jgi:hypothetical protein
VYHSKSTKVNYEEVIVVTAAQLLALHLAPPYREQIKQEISKLTNRLVELTDMLGEDDYTLVRPSCRDLPIELPNNMGKVWATEEQAEAYILGFIDSSSQNYTEGRRYPRELLRMWFDTSDDTL